MNLTKEYILNLVETNDAALCRALVFLNERQTVDEQVSKTTRQDNGQGFLPAHAEIGTGMAQYFLKHGKLSPAQLAVWRKKTATGRTKIGIYAGQLLAIAKEKQKNTPAPAPARNMYHGSDLGNLAEERMVLEEEISMAQDSDDDSIMEPLYEKLMRIKEAEEEIRRQEFKYQREYA